MAGDAPSASTIAATPSAIPGSDGQDRAIARKPLWQRHWKLGAVVIEGVAIVDLPELGGSKRLRESGLAVHCLVDFAGH